MNNFSVASSTNSTTGSNWFSAYCNIHGWNSCTCNNISPGLSNLSVCNTCGMQFDPNTSGHLCTGSGSLINPYPFSSHVICGVCNQAHNPQFQHVCPPTTPTFTWTGTSTLKPSFKGIKEITTDQELIYELDSFSGGSLKLPSKFSDCFLKVENNWFPTYPLIFSAFENDSEKLSFHIVREIEDKKFEGDSVVLKYIKTSKIEDNLTLVQLCQRTKDFFKAEK